MHRGRSSARVVEPDDGRRRAVRPYGVLLAMSAGFAVLAQLLAGRGTTPWMWLIGGATFFVAGLAISEMWFGWATEEDLQPNYDGLSFDETLLALIPSIAVVLLARRITRVRRCA